MVMSVATVPSAFGQASLNLTWSQSSGRSLTSTSGGVTSIQGYPASIVSQTSRPFVTGVTPVVSDFTGGGSDVGGAQRRQVIAQIATAKRQRMERQLRRTLVRAQRAAEKRDWRAARANYRTALRMADLPTAAAIRQQLDALTLAAKADSASPPSVAR